MNKIKMLYTDIEEIYSEWINSIKDNINKVEKVEPYYKNAKNADDCSYLNNINNINEFDIVFFHAGNCNAIQLINEKVSKKSPLVYFTGGGIGNDEKEALASYEIKYLISGFNHYSSCPWFFKDFFDDWVERVGPEKAAPNFDILEKGNSQVAIETLHKLREEILTPLTALHLLLQTDIKPEEIERIFKDTKGNKLDISDHISKSKSTLNALQKNISLNNIPSADRIHGFSDDQDLLRIKKHIDEKLAEELLTPLYTKISGLNIPDFKSIQNSRNKLVLEIENFATAFENLIQHIEEKALVQ